MFRTRQHPQTKKWNGPPWAAKENGTPSHQQRMGRPPTFTHYTFLLFRSCCKQQGERKIEHCVQQSTTLFNSGYRHTQVSRTSDPQRKALWKCRRQRCTNTWNWLSWCCSLKWSCVRDCDVFGGFCSSTHLVYAGFGVCILASFKRHFLLTTIFVNEKQYCEEPKCLQSPIYADY